MRVFTMVECTHDILRGLRMVYQAGAGTDTKPNVWDGGLCASLDSVMQNQILRWCLGNMTRLSARG